MRDASIRTKLLLLLLLPFAGLLYFSGMAITERRHTVDELRALRLLVHVAVKTGATIHELQKERGLSAGFIGTQGGNFTAELSVQRTRVDTQLADLQIFLRDPRATPVGDDFKRALDTAQARLARLAALRDAVSALKASGRQSFDDYSSVIDSLLEIAAAVTEASKDDAIARAALSYSVFLKGKEQTGRERATLNAVFAANRFEAESLQRFIALVAREETYLDLFAAYASGRTLALYREKMAGDYSAEVGGMRRAALDRMASGSFGIEPGQWFAAVTHKINAMKDIEDSLAAELDELAANGIARAEQELWLTAGATAAVLAVALLVSYLVAMRILSSMRKLHETMKVMHETHDLTLQCEAGGRDEIGQMATAFNGLTARFREIVAGIHLDAERATIAASGLAAAAAQVRRASEVQSETVAASAAALEQMTVSVASVADSANQVAQISHESLLRAQDGNVSLSELFGAIDAAETTVKNTADSVNEFIDDANNISRLTQEVRDIAEQTNLLALNAAIEAARAGEHGRGFAVVADEVRKLAEKSAASANEIDVLTRAVGQHSERVAASVRGGVDSLIASQSAMENVATVMADAAHSVRDTTRGVHEITAAVTEQNSAMEDIARRVDAMARVAEENSGSAAAVWSAADNLQQLAVRLQGAVGRFQH